MSFKTKFSLLAGIAGLIGLAAAADQYFNRTLSYTNNTSVQKVKNARSSHDQTTPSLNLWATAKPTSTPSADSLFLAHNGDLLAGGQSAGSGHNTNSVAGTSTGVASGSSNSDQSALYLAMDPGGTKFYTSDLSGALNTVSLPSGAQGTTTAITTGGNSSGTPIALAPNGNVSQAGGSNRRGTRRYERGNSRTAAARRRISGRDPRCVYLHRGTNGHGHWRRVVSTS